jgi:hypothetical protein
MFQKRVPGPFDSQGLNTMYSSIRRITAPAGWVQNAKQPFPVPLGTD